MGLDITFTQRKKQICPHCGKVAGHIDVHTADCGGRGWYPFLTSIGYYCDDWYGKDMVLTDEQADEAYRFAKENDLYGSDDIPALIATARYEKDDIVINADW